eukprot:sb/3478525/
METEDIPPPKDKNILPEDVLPDDLPPSPPEHATPVGQDDISRVSDDWLDLSTPTGPPHNLNTSLKRDVESLFSSVESFTDLASSTTLSFGAGSGATTKVF